MVAALILLLYGYWKQSEYSVSMHSIYFTHAGRVAGIVLLDTIEQDIMLTLQQCNVEKFSSVVSMGKTLIFYQVHGR